MFSPKRIAIGLALLAALITSTAVFAKGSFSFIAVTGANLKSEVRVTDPDLTNDFFAFADFHMNISDAPSNPGVGYEISRYYVDGNREVVFDLLHYYPDTGYVFYDGIVNGSSEYDGEWYIARPGIKPVFENALSSALVAKPELIRPGGQVQSGASMDPAQSTPAPSQRTLFVSIAIMAGLAGFLVLAFSRRNITVR